MGGLRGDLNRRAGHRLKNQWEALAPTPPWGGHGTTASNRGHEVVLASKGATLNCENGSAHCVHTADGGEEGGGYQQWGRGQD